mmetsp:Transcript_8632/g.17872  ORF Transcript_8632/g.17872 Transcript_8632/m.17872 type:complete len:203 (+) Transcript_8632:973-1581(+)
MAAAASLEMPSFWKARLSSPGCAFRRSPAARTPCSPKALSLKSKVTNLAFKSPSQIFLSAIRASAVGRPARMSLRSTSFRVAALLARAAAAISEDSAPKLFELNFTLTNEAPGANRGFRIVSASSLVTTSRPLEERSNSPAPVAADVSTSMLCEAPSLSKLLSSRLKSWVYIRTPSTCGLAPVVTLAAISALAYALCSRVRT